MFSIFNQLFGCANQTQAAGPDFSAPIAKVAHIGRQTSVFYAMPGNLSKELNFDKVYERDTAKSYQIDPQHLSKAEQLTWRALQFIDVGKWDYLGKKSEGPNGILGNLQVELGYSLLPKGQTLQQHINQAYEHYLNGEKGLNKKFLTDEEGNKVDKEDYAEMAAKAPVDFQRRTIGGAEFITWKTDQEFDGYKNTPYIYYVLPIEQIGYLTFLFSYKISVFGQALIDVQQKKIEQDIDAFMSKVTVEQKSP